MKFLTALIAAVTLCACGSRSSDEQQVRELLAALEQAAEARDASDVLTLVADDFASDDVAGKADLTRFLRGYFLAHPRVDVSVDVESLELPVPDLAQARLELRVAPAGDHATLDVEFRRLDGDWRVTRAERATEP